MIPLTRSLSSLHLFLAIEQLKNKCSIVSWYRPSVYRMWGRYHHTFQTKALLLWLNPCWIIRHINIQVSGIAHPLHSCFQYAFQCCGVPCWSNLPLCFSKQSLGLVSRCIQVLLGWVHPPLFPFSPAQFQPLLSTMLVSLSCPLLIISL